jgi:ADP-heptose:LPS heptosyltransferase
MQVDLERPWLVIHVGATAASRRYSPAGFAEVARRLALAEGRQVLFIGTELEREVVEEIRAGMGAPSHSLVNSLNLAELAALLALSPLLISNFQ